MSKLYLQHDYKITGRDYVDTDSSDIPIGGVNYSTDEQDTGLKWIDGKSIYQRTLEITADEITAHTGGGSALAVCDTIVDISGFYYTPYIMITLNTYESDTHFARCVYRPDEKNLGLVVTGYTATGAIITVKYTKTE